VNVLVRLSGWLFEVGALPYAIYTDVPAWRASCARLADAIPPGDAPLVLDLGCGPGVTICAMAERRPDARYVGLDISTSMLAIARERLYQRQKRTQLLAGDATRLPLCATSVDMVTGHSFLYLLPDPAGVLASTYGVVRMGGVAAFMEPREGYVSPPELLSFSRDPRFLLSVILWRVMSRAHRRYTHLTLGQALSSAGFVDIHTDVVLGGLGVLAWGKKPDDTV